MELRLRTELRMSMQLRMSLAQDRATKLQRTRNLRLALKRMNQQTRPRLLRGSSALSSGEKA